MAHLQKSTDMQQESVPPTHYPPGNPHLAQQLWGLDHMFTQITSALP